MAVAEELNFGRAAARVHISQPALSRQVMNLEDELGAKLLVRSSQAVALTEPGVALLEQARQLLLAARSIPAAVHRVAQGETGRLRIGFVGSTLFTSVPVLLHQYRRTYPLVAVELHQATVARQIQLLHRQDIDVGIVRQSINDAALRTRKLFQESFIVALPVDHPLARQERVMLRDLALERFVAFSRSEAPNIFSQFRHMCEVNGFVPDVVQEANPLTTVVGLVAAGVGIAIVPDSMRRIRFEGVTYLDLGGTRERSAFFLAWRRGDASATLTNFLQTAKEVEF